MRERIIENWLDNASERSYQPVFCQFLISKGYTLIHSTRHCAAEQGKDIIAINPEGVACAFQLKGNPQGRLNLKTFREDIEPQLRALTHQVIQNTAVPKGKHLSYFVTNGRVEEEVSQAIESNNQVNEIDGLPHRNVVVIARDELLSNFKALENGLWPSELQQTRTLLEILTTDGTSLFPLEKFHKLLSDVLLLNKDSKFSSTADFNRRASSAGVLTGICLDTFSRQQNHYAVISAWVMLSMYLIAASEKWSTGKKQLASLLDITNEAIVQSLIDLIEETVNRNGVLRQGDPSTDYCTYAWRYTVLKSIMAIGTLINAGDYTENPDEFQKRVNNFLDDDTVGLDFVGESNLPGILLLTLAETYRGEHIRAKKLATRVLEHCLYNNPLPIYYTASEIIEDRLSEYLSNFESISKNEEGRSLRSSWFARQAFMNMVLLDSFDECEQNWATYSTFRTTEFHPSKPWQYCTYRCDEGENYVFQSEPQESWSNLKIQIQKSNISELIPAELIRRPELLAIWMLICPQRATFPVITFLHKAFKIDRQVKLT